jgi:hypothetical protein
MKIKKNAKPNNRKVIGFSNQDNQSVEKMTFANKYTPIKKKLKQKKGIKKKKK